MFGEISAWYYKALGGLFPDASAPGFKHIILKPNFVTGLNSFEANHVSPYGEIVSSWSKNRNKVQYTVTIPSNTSASLYLDDAYIVKSKEIKSQILSAQREEGSIKLTPGTYHFEIRIK